MISSGINLWMAVIGFTLSIMFIVFVCTRLICARIYMNASRRPFPRASGSNHSTLERGLHGLEPRTLANFPTKKYKELCLSSKENSQCAVCLSDYHEEDTLRILPACGHSFHATCIDIWLHQHFTCPVCRISLRGLPERKWFMQPMFSSASRPHQGMHSVNAQYCRCMASSNGRSSRPHDNGRTNAIQEAHCQSEGNGGNVGDSNTISIDHRQNIKNLANGEIESSSNQ